jgi:hypothetical protein
MGDKEFYGTDTFGTDTEQRLGQCTDLAFRALFRAPEGTKLVHASMTSPMNRTETAGLKLGHAFLRLPDGRIWDPPSALHWDPQVYNVLGGIHNEREYTKDEAGALAMRHRHGGPWEIPEGELWGPPPKKTRRRKQASGAHYNEGYSMGSRHRADAVYEGGQDPAHEKEKRQHKRDLDNFLLSQGVGDWSRAASQAHFDIGYDEGYHGESKSYNKSWDRHS